MGKVFLCFLSLVFDQYFSCSKAHKGASLDRFSLCTFVLLSRIFLFFEQDFVYKLLFSQRSLKIDPGPSNQATGFLELSNASAVNCFSSFGCGYAAPGFFVFFVTLGGLPDRSKL
jgi:hypothetical protein